MADQRTLLTEWKHDDLATDLAAHLRASGDVMTFENLQMGQSGSPRPDVLTFAKTYTKLDVRAYEVKISRSDFRSDTTAGKWRGYLAFASSVTFAVPAGLIDKAEVPPQCGLIVRGESGTWRHVRKPQPQLLANLPWEAWLKLLMDGVAREGEQRRHQHFNEWVGARALAKKFGQDAADMVRRLHELPQQYENEKIVRQTQLEAQLKALRDGLDEARVEAAKMRAAIDPEVQELGDLLGIKRSGQLRWELPEVIRLLRGSDRIADARAGLARQIRLLQEADGKLAAMGDAPAANDASTLELPSEGLL